MVILCAVFGCHHCLGRFAAVPGHKTVRLSVKSVGIICDLVIVPEIHLGVYIVGSVPGAEAGSLVAALHIPVPVAVVNGDNATIQIDIKCGLVRFVIAEFQAVVVLVLNVLFRTAVHAIDIVLTLPCRFEIIEGCPVCGRTGLSRGRLYDTRSATGVSIEGICKVVAVNVADVQASRMTHKIIQALDLMPPDRNRPGAVDYRIDAESVCLEAHSLPGRLRVHHVAACVFIGEMHDVQDIAAAVRQLNVYVNSGTCRRLVPDRMIILFDNADIKQPDIGRASLVPAQGILSLRNVLII